MNVSTYMSEIVGILAACLVYRGLSFMISFTSKKDPVHGYSDQRWRDHKTDQGF